MMIPRGMMYFGVVVALSLTGCAPVHPKWPEPGRVASAAVDVEDAIAFDMTGGDVDVEAGGAPSAGATEGLALAEAVRQALATSSEIQAALARVRVAQADAEQARLLPNPIVRIALRFPEGGGQPIVEAGVAAELLSLLQRPGRIDAADHRLRAASAEAVTTILDVLAEVQEQYATVQSLQALEPLLEERRDLLERLQGLARSRREAGEGDRLEVVTLDAQRVEIEAEIDDLQLELTEQRLALLRLIGRPSGDATLRVKPWEAPEQERVDESAWVTAALENRPEVRWRLWELAALGVEVRLTRFEPLETGRAGVDVEKEGPWTIGPSVAIPLPLFDWGQAQRKKIAAQRIEARHELTQTRRKVIEQVRRACAAYNESIHELNRIRTQLIPLQEQRRELAEAALRAGQTDAATLIMAERDLAAARASVVELEQRNFISRVRLHRAVGGPGHAPSAEASPSPNPPNPEDES